MIWGVMNNRGQAYEFPFPHAGTLPLYFDAENKSFTLAEEYFQLEYVGRSGFRFPVEGPTWGKARQFVHTDSPGGDVLASKDGILLIGGAISKMKQASYGGASATAGELFFGKGMHLYCFVRKEEVKGWRSGGNQLDVFLLPRNEIWMIPTAKAIFTLRRPGNEVLELFKTLAPEVQDVDRLDKEVDMDLPPERVSRGKSFWMVLSPILIGLIGMPSTLAVASLFEPGSPGAIASVSVGMALLFGGLIGFFVVWHYVNKVLNPRLLRKFREINRRRFRQEFVRSHRRFANELRQATARYEIPLDYTPRTLHTLVQFERSIQYGGHNYWFPSVVRYAAYLGEVFKKDVGHRIHVDWIEFDDRLMFQFAEIGQALDLETYADGRLKGIGERPPDSQYNAWKLDSYVIQAAAPIGVLQLVGLLPQKVDYDASDFWAIAGRACNGQRVPYKRPFGEFATYRLPVNEGIHIQYNVRVRTEGYLTKEEPLCLRAVFETMMEQECVVMQLAELPCRAEAILFGEFGGTPGQPLVLSALVTDYLSVAPEKLGIGQSRPISMSAVGLSGEFGPPVQMDEGLMQSQGEFGTSQPYDPTYPLDARFLITGMIEDCRTVSLEGSHDSFHILVVNVQGARFPVLVPDSRCRGTPEKGLAFTGDILLQARLGRSSAEREDVSVA